MKCPNCNYSLKEKGVTTNIKLVANIDQCDRCGGIWFDKNELYQISLDEAKKIDIVDDKILNKKTEIKVNLCCPRDGTALSRLTDPNIPESIYIERCDFCGGAWLNQGELSKYKKIIKNKNNKQHKSGYQEKELKTNISRICGFLMTPMNMNSAETDIARMEDIDNPTITRKEAEILKKIPKDKKERIYKEMLWDEKSRIRDINMLKRVVMGIIGMFKI